jgi:hypothetical protein
VWSRWSAPVGKGGELLRGRTMLGLCRFDAVAGLPGVFGEIQCHFSL